MPSNQSAGGWRVLFSSESAGSYILTVEMTSVESGRVGQTAVWTDVFMFDHEPTQAEIQAAVDASGFSPVMTSQPKAPISRDYIMSATEGEPDIIEYDAQKHPAEFQSLFARVPIQIAEVPTSMSLKGDWLYLYYAGYFSIPEQFFSETYYLYSVRVHKDTGEVRRKGYNNGLTLSAEQLAKLQGFDQIGQVIATGVYLDEPMVTLYHMRRSDPEGLIANPWRVDMPYVGTTWESGIITRVREYSRGMPTAEG